MKTNYCLCCGSDNIQAVPAIVDAGTWRTTGTSTMIGIDGHGDLMTGAAMSQGHGTTRLASLLAPPPKPIGLPNNRAMVWFAVGVTWLLFALITAGREASNQTLGDYWPGILFIAGIGLGITGRGAWLLQIVNRSWEEADATTPKWERQIAAWSGLVYCHKCGNIINPQTGDHAPANALRRLLTLV